MHLVSKDRKGLSRTQGLVHQGANSGYQAINLAYLLGATRVILLGYDAMGVGIHWFGKHPEGLSQSSNYSNLVSHFASIKPSDYGIEIINCSRETALHFPRMDLDECLKQVKQLSS